MFLDHSEQEEKSPKLIFDIIIVVPLNTPSERSLRVNSYLIPAIALILIQLFFPFKG
jgi:hypothetical protein